MPKYRVYGKIVCFIDCKVEISQDRVNEAMERGDSINELVIEEAYETFGGVTCFAGNGGSDKIIGVSGSGESIYPCDEFEFNEVEEI